jgi:hypothetical protein
VSTDKWQLHEAKNRLSEVVRKAREKVCKSLPCMRQTQPLSFRRRTLPGCPGKKVGLSLFSASRRWSVLISIFRVEATQAGK